MNRQYITFNCVILEQRNDQKMNTPYLHTEDMIPARGAQTRGERQQPFGKATLWKGKFWEGNLLERQPFGKVATFWKGGNLVERWQPFGKVATFWKGKFWEGQPLERQSFGKAANLVERCQPFERQPFGKATLGNLSRSLSASPSTSGDRKSWKTNLSL